MLRGGGGGGGAEEEKTEKGEGKIERMGKVRWNVERDG